MRLVTFALRIFNRRTDEQRIVYAVPEIDRSLSGHSEMADRNNPRTYAAVGNRLNQRGCEHDVDNAVIVAQCGANLEIDNRGVNQSINRNEWLDGGRWGLLCHDGSYKLFKWDIAAGCMAPFELSNPKP